MPQPEKIAVIDDDGSMLKALVRLLAGSGREVFAFSSAKEFITFAETQSVLCVISDLWMPEISGLELQRLMVERMPDTAVIILTGHADVPSSVRALKVGAVDFLEKPVQRDQLLDAVARATSRTRDFREKAAVLTELERRYSELTPRESEVFGLLATGLLNKQVGAQLGAAEKTIKQHRGVIMHKMQADSFADLVLMASLLGIIPVNSDVSRAKGILRPS
jgi:FixJ family two-component response regulator